MNWSVYVDGGNYSVSVREGIAVLNGKASDWKEVQQVVKKAFQGGARKVMTNLTLEQGRPVKHEFEYRDIRLGL